MKPISSLTKVDQVRQAVLEQIFNRSLRPGQRLVEAKLAADLAVSQATINSALQDLHNQGVVTKVMNRSTNVSRYTLREIEHLFAVRLILEPEAARAASKSLYPQGAADLWEQLENMLRAARENELSRFCLADYTFHQQVFQLTRNPFLIQACEAIAAAPFAYLLCDSADTLPTDYVALAESHRVVIQGLEKGPDFAERMIRERIAEWRDHSIHALEAAERGAAPVGAEDRSEGKHATQ
jgi:DNA-binding GntR family transcriptional regulator